MVFFFFYNHYQSQIQKNITKTETTITSINTNNFYNYALHNNINNNIINNNIINTVPEARNIPSSYIPETFGGKFIDYSNPLNFQSEAFAIFIKKEKLKIEKRKLDLLSNNKDINKDTKINDIADKEILNNSFDEINETPKYTGKKKLRDKTSNLNSIKSYKTITLRERHLSWSNQTGNKTFSLIKDITIFIRRKNQIFLHITHILYYFLSLIFIINILL